MRVDRSERSNIYSALLMLLFVIVIYFLADFIVMRDLDKNIELKSRVNLQQTIMNYMEENQAHLQEELEQYSPIVEYYEKGGLIEDIDAFIRNYFKDSQVDKVYENVQNGVRKGRYLVKATIPSPGSFFEFLDAVMDKKLPIAVELPVKFVKNGDSVDVTFFVEVYRSAK